MTAVADTSVLLALAKIGHLELLSQLFDRVIIPEGVRAEALDVKDASENRRIVEALSLGWLTVEAGLTPSSPGNLGRGESEVMDLALRTQPDAVLLDDRDARREAKSRGLPVLGTIGVLVAARRAGHLKSILPLIEQLRSVGFWIGDEVIAAVQREEER